MSRDTTFRFVVALIIVVVLSIAMADAGMPSPLPTRWTKDGLHAPSAAPAERGPVGDARLQAISFFVACLLLSAWGVQRLWLILRRDLTWLPTLSYRRSLSLVVLWGLLFVVVLTMISGARELMTPGAWRKQGWTYKLADVPPSTVIDPRTERHAALEQLRLALWQYAATHQGRFPTSDDRAIETSLWQVPGQPGITFGLVPNRQAEEVGQLLVYEPALSGDERQVLLTNGMIGTMRSGEIRQAITGSRTTAKEVSHGE